MRHAVIAEARLLHVPVIFIARNGAPAQRAVGDRLQQGFFGPGLTRALTRYRMAAKYTTENRLNENPGANSNETIEAGTFIR